MVSNSTEEGGVATRVNELSGLAGLSYIPQEVLALAANAVTFELAEAVRNIDWSAPDNAMAYGQATGGAALELVKDGTADEELDPTFIAARDAAIRDIRAAAGLSNEEIEAIVSAIGDTRNMVQLINLLTVDGINAVVAGAGTKARELVDSICDAVQAREELKRQELELQNLYDSLFDENDPEDREKRRRLDALTHDAIYGADDAQATAARNQAVGIVHDQSYDNAIANGASTAQASAQADADAAAAATRIDATRTSLYSINNATDVNALSSSSTFAIERDSDTAEPAQTNAPDQRNATITATTLEVAEVDAPAGLSQQPATLVAQGSAPAESASIDGGISFG